MLNLIADRVMIFGTFDVLHPGHRFFIEEAIKLGVGSRELRVGNPKRRTPNSKRRTDLIIVVARDKTVKKLKPVLKNSEQFRLKVLEETFPEAKVVLGDEEDPMKVIRKFRPGLICLGYDQVGFSEQLKQEFPEIKMVRIEAFESEKYKSSKF